MPDPEMPDPLIRLTGVTKRSARAQPRSRR